MIAEPTDSTGPSLLDPGQVRTVVYDLDGTLLDSLPLIAASVAKVRERRGLAPVSDETVRRAIGDGARKLCERIFSPPFDGPALDEVFDEFLSDYATRSAEEANPWRPGARALLDRAAARGLEQAVLTNKPLALSEAILARTETRPLFREVRCPENSPAPKPDPRSLLDLCEALGVAPEACLFVGDSVVDFETGRRAGIATVGLRGGYRGEGSPPPDLWFDDPAEFSEWLLAGG